MSPLSTQGKRKRLDILLKRVKQRAKQIPILNAVKSMPLKKAKLTKLLVRIQSRRMR